MRGAVIFIDRMVKRTLTAFCAVLLLLMVAFTVYSVVMRYVFENPPVWGDLLTVLSNIWLVFFALALTVRDRDHIALDLIYSWLPLKAAFAIQQFWSLVIFGLGIVMIVYGLEAVATMGGKYWEMWYFAWEDGGLVFKPNYMPKKYAIAIVPISGFLVSVAALASIIEDTFRLRSGNYQQAKDIDAHSD
ncbi:MULTISPECIES: TRAP transporter small permease [unclassified Roseovarius]|uniref:TRAP transporter small permease n=1 Tax=unclassified Roseovarius TaxID=2614913 RepID=UPI00273E3374|nr:MULTISPECIES: TRAP transporter small permease [unclassified Roseovarius]